MGRFRIKISSWWASNDWVQFWYSTNGIIWRRVHTLEYDILDEWYYMVPLTVSYRDAEYYIKKFSTIEAIREYEREDRARCNKENQRIKDWNDRKDAERKSVYKRFS